MNQHAGGGLIIMDFSFVDIVNVGVMLINATMPAWGMLGGIALGSWVVVQVFTFIREQVA